MNVEKKLIGRAEIVRFPELKDQSVYSRIDSGARTSAIWGEATLVDNGKLEVSFFGDSKNTFTFSEYGKQVVASSNGHIDERYTIRIPVVLMGRRIRATFTIANRQTQVYPVLIGRNVLRGKFIIDVKLGKVLSLAEKKRIAILQSQIKNKEAS